MNGDAQELFLFMSETHWNNGTIEKPFGLELKSNETLKIKCGLQIIRFQLLYFIDDSNRTCFQSLSNIFLFFIINWSNIDNEHFVQGIVDVSFCSKMAYEELHRCIQIGHAAP